MPHPVADDVVNPGSSSVCPGKIAQHTLKTKGECQSHACIWSPYSCLLQEVHRACNVKLSGTTVNTSFHFLCCMFQGSWDFLKFLWIMSDPSRHFWDRRHGTAFWSQKYRNYRRLDGKIQDTFLKNTRDLKGGVRATPGTVVGESPDCLLLSGTVVGENPDYVCWDWIQIFICDL